MKYTLKFYKGRKLIAEHSFEVDPGIHDIEAFTTDTAYDSAQMIQEAIECNAPEAKG